MKPQDRDAAAHDAKSEANQGLLKEVGRAVARGVGEEAITAIKWGGGCAVLGGALFGGLGLWQFGLHGLVMGAFVGALLGGVGGVMTYLLGTS